MTRAESFAGRVALAEGPALAGVTVELEVAGATTATAVTDATGAFTLTTTFPAGAPDVPTGHLVVRLPGNQVVLREIRALDGRHLGLLVPRAGMPRGTPRRGVDAPPPRVAEAPPPAVDVGERGVASRPLLEAPGRVRPAGTRRMVTVGDQAFVAAGPELIVWPLDADDVPAAARIDIGAEVLDLAPGRDPGVLQVLTTGDGDRREVLTWSRFESLDRRWSGEGGWSRLAVSRVSGALALAADGSGAVAIIDDGEERRHDVGVVVFDVAFSGPSLVLAGQDELLELEPPGRVTGRLGWPGRPPALVAGDNGELVAFDPARGAATRLVHGRDGLLRADESLLVGGAVTAVGWWRDRGRFLALDRSAVVWWRPPLTVQTARVAPPDDIEFVGPV
jgi:hypothetical protein